MALIPILPVRLQIGGVFIIAIKIQKQQIGKKFKNLKTTSDTTYHSQNRFFRVKTRVMHAFIRFDWNWLNSSATCRCVPPTTPPRIHKYHTIICVFFFCFIFFRCPPLSGRPCIRKTRPVNSTLNYIECGGIFRMRM